MQKDPQSLKVTDKQWTGLAPRSTDPQVLYALINGKPVQVVGGFCELCDSNIGKEWCIAGTKGRHSQEIRHLADRDIGILRPSELAIIMTSLASQA